MSNNVPKDAEYRVLHDGLIRLHELFLLGRERCDEAEEIRDSSERLWCTLPDGHRRLLSGLSKDLNDIKHVESEDPRGEVSPVFGQALHTLCAGNYVEALEILRTNKTIPPFSRVSYLRGKVWEELDEAKTALLFFEHAARLDPDNPDYQTAVIQASEKHERSCEDERESLRGDIDEELDNAI